MPFGVAARTLRPASQGGQALEQKRLFESDSALAGSARVVGNPEFRSTTVFSTEWFIPPRQYLAYAYMIGGKLTDAERVFREDLKRHRANGWSLRGLEQVLRKQEKTAEADRTHEEFQRAWKRADVKLAESRF